MTVAPSPAVSSAMAASGVERLVRGQQPVTADTALRLGRVFGMDPQFWITLQATHDLSKAAIESRDALAEIKPLPAPEPA